MQDLGKLGKLAVTLLPESLGLGYQLCLCWLSLPRFVNLLFKILDFLRFEQLHEQVKLGELLFNDGSGGGGAGWLEVVGRGNDGGDSLDDASVITLSETTWIVSLPRCLVFMAAMTPWPSLV